MVVLGNGREGGVEKFMEMGPEIRSKPLHNFSMPSLKWGNQRFLRCRKVDSNDEVSADDPNTSASEAERVLIGRGRESKFERRGSSDRRENFTLSPEAEVGGSGRKSKAESDEEDGLEAVREKLTFDLQMAADKMKNAFLREGLKEGEQRPATPPAEADIARPWNLRTRRAACKAPNGISSYGSGGDALKPNFPPLSTKSKSSRFRGRVVSGTIAPSGEKREREKFSVSLSRREIEADFMAMAEQRLPRRPKKRSKIVQKQLDTLFPGLWLTEVTADLYKVPDAPETGKR